MIEIISVRFKNGGKQYYFNPNGLQFAEGDGVIVETSRGMEYGECTQANSMIDEMELTAPLRPVLRAATEEDKVTVEKNKEKEEKAFQVCQEKITEHGLDMKLVEVEYSFEGNKILFFFTSEGRVDFRALVKDLAGTLHARIELRQIGVRDEAKMLGGLGICGRPFCCSQFLNEFQPVSIKMAKTQNLSLNPTKISGTCGRLMCCLKYEQDAYVGLVKRAPKADSFVETPDGAGTVTNVNLLRETVQVRLDSDPETARIYHNTELNVVRSGKGRRPDDYVEPSLEELAKLRRQPEQPETPVLKEEGSSLGAAIQAVFERGEQSAQPRTEDQPQEVRPRRRRGDRSKKPTQTAEKVSAPKAEKPAEQTLTIRPKKPNQPKTQAPKVQMQPKAAPAADAPKAEGAPKKNFHRRRRRGGGGAKPQGGEQ